MKMVQADPLVGSMDEILQENSSSDSQFALRLGVV
jgi:hypothetical protein